MTQPMVLIHDADFCEVVTDAGLAFTGTLEEVREWLADWFHTEAAA